MALPDSDGFSVCRELKKSPKTHGIPVLIVTSMTGRTENPDYLESIAAQHSADAFASRPLTPEAFSALVEKHIRRG